MKRARAKKLFASLPMIGLILGAVAIAMELHRPMPCDQLPAVRVPTCQTVIHDSKHISHTEDPVICAR